MRFNPTVYNAGCCNTELYSRFPGEFRECFCGNVAVDQTEFYERKIGGFDKLTRVRKLLDEPEEIEER